MGTHPETGFCPFPDPKVLGPKIDPPPTKEGLPHGVGG